jgi:hypothetical protein
LGSHHDADTPKTRGGSVIVSDHAFAVTGSTGIAVQYRCIGV